MNKKLKIISFLTFLTVGFGFFSDFASAATNIVSVSPYYYAWNDIIGWINFYSTGNVYLSTTNLTGYANSDIGYIAFDCASSPTPPTDCVTTFPDWHVTRSGSSLSGWAWNDQIGWISFDCHNTNTCLTSNYQVTLSGDEFIGYAWNDIIGWISFNCTNSGTCATVDYKVKRLPEVALTGSLISSTFDTGVAGGVVYNTVLYHGTKPVGTEVKLQLATSDSSSGPWNFSGYDGTDTTFYTPIGPDVSIALNPVLYKNKRYFRYKIFLSSDTYQSLTPEVTGVVVTWSR